MQRNLKLALFAVAVALGALLAYPHAGRDGQAELPRPALAWSPGMRAVYTLSMSSRVEAQTGGLLADLRLEGPLRVAVLGSQPRVALHVAFEGRAQIGDGAAPDSAVAREVASFEAGLRAPFIIDLAAEGTLHGLRVDPTLSPAVVKIWQAFAATLQTSPRRSGAASWSGEEHDEVGSYVAEYAADGASSFARSKRSYTETRSSAASYELLAATAAFSLDETHKLVHLEAIEKVRATASNGALSFLSIMTIGLARASLESGAAGTQPATGLAHLVAAAPGQTSASSTPASTDDARIGGHTLSSVLAALLELQGRAGSLDEADEERRGRAYVALAALLRRNPEHLAAVREHIEKNGPLATTLVTALRDADTPESQALLADLIDGGKLSREMRMDATRSLSRVEHPTAATVAALTALQADTDVGVQATYGLGSNVYRLQRQEPELARAVAAQLVGQLEEAEDDLERATLLTALGNAGTPDALDAIDKQLASPQEYVRVAAADALRRIPGARADELLARAARDASARVRHKAFESFSERAAAGVLVAALAVAVVSEPDFQARARAVKVAIKWLAGQDALAVSLEVVANRDQSEDLRQLARRALQI